MNRTLFLFVAFLILGAGVVAWYLSRQDDKTSLLAAERSFAVKDTAGIYRIFIADRKGGQTNLERKNGYWLFDGKYKARPTAVNNLLDAISRTEVKYKPPRAAVPAMVKSLATEGLKVELYDKRGDLIKSFYVGGATSDERGTYMMNADAEEPYVTQLAGWEGNLRFRYNLVGEDWRDRTVIAFEPEDIAAVSVEYPKQRDKSFRLQREGNGFSVLPFYEINAQSGRPVSKGTAEAYLVGFKSLVAEGFENKLPQRDSISRLIPFSVITVKDKTGKESTVRFYPVFYEDGIDPKTGQQLPAPAVERYYADCNGQDFMMVQHRVFGKVFWAYDAFFE